MGKIIFHCIFLGPLRVATKSQRRFKCRRGSCIVIHCGVEYYKELESLAI